MESARRALLVIDLQNDYFPGGNYPLWNAEATLDVVERAIARARQLGDAVILIQHVASGPSPFFQADTPGVQLHPRILASAPDAPIVVKTWADAFFQTHLEETLQRLNVEELLVCGMMTQNCVTHTAISKQAEKYSVRILSDACTTIDPMIHAIALKAVSSRMELVTSEAALAPPPLLQ